MIYVIIAVLIFIADSVIKYKIEHDRKTGDVSSIFNGKILLKKYHNTGAMLNLGAAKPKFMAAVSLVFTAFMSGIFVATLGHKGHNVTKAGLALLLGGAFSNTYDRLRRKYVVDYISFPVKNDRIRKIVFNVSDFGIMIGALFLIISESFNEDVA